MESRGPRLRPEYRTHSLNGRSQELAMVVSLNYELHVSVESDVSDLESDGRIPA